MKRSLILSFGAVCILGTAEAVAVKTNSKAEVKQWWNDPAPAPAPAPSSSSPALPVSDNSWDDFSWDSDNDDKEDKSQSSSIEADIAASLSLD